jgi:pyruvate/2-oxoglutarate dehydrogenase complex dihydrolipoamide acyltransferase (E2) component
MCLSKPKSKMYNIRQQQDSPMPLNKKIRQATVAVILLWMTPLRKLRIQLKYAFSSTMRSTPR